MWRSLILSLLAFSPGDLLWGFKMKSTMTMRVTSARLCSSRSSGNEPPTTSRVASKAPELSTQSRGFLTSIVDYGNARMAKRAVDTLNKMSDYKCAPVEEHYTEALWACCKSDMYELALEVFEEMRDAGLAPSTRTYEALVSVAEKTDHWQEALAFLDELAPQGLRGSKDLFNSCMWAADKGGRPEIAVSLLGRMESEGIERDLDSYTAATWACEKQGDAAAAQHISDLMHAEGVAMSTGIYRGMMWAQLKGGNPHKALAFFDEMGARGVLHDNDCYNAAIWACEQEGNAQRSVSLLRLMKLEGFKRSTMSFDGAISALAAAGDATQILDILTWMDRDQPPVKKSALSFKLAVDTLDAAGNDAKAMELYLQALREGHYSPWMKNSRKLDLRGMSLGIAKASVLNVLESMRKGTLSRFPLDIVITDAYDGEEGQGWQFDRTSFDVGQLADWLLRQSPVDVLVGEVRIEESLLHIYFTQENIVEWCVSSPFDPNNWKRD